VSQHLFDTWHEGAPVTVMLGWDRRLACFFLVIGKLHEPDEDERLLYSNLHEREPFNQGLDDYREVLRRFQIDVPESLFSESLSDRERNIGNRIVDHQADGSFVEQWV